MDTKLADHVAHFKKILAEHHVDYHHEKAINYGCQLECTYQGQSAKVNLYHGKKGFSTVIQGPDGALKALLQSLVSGSAAGGRSGTKQTAAAIPLPPGTTTWMGCDESGKGDVFGPIVAAACMVTTETAAKLQQAGVCDSKALTDKAIMRLADIIRDVTDSHWAVRVVMPGEYNQMYEMYHKKHQNLNNLLGNLHAQNIRVLLSKYECPCIIVDKFGKEEYVLSGLGGLEKTHTVIQVPKGERDIAVAAASILAREAFVKAMDELHSQFGMTFPKGAYMGISDTIKKVREQFGAQALIEVGKLNFKNFDFLR